MLLVSTRIRTSLEFLFKDLNSMSYQIIILRYHIKIILNSLEKDVTNIL